MVWQTIKRWGRLIFYHKPITISKKRGYELEMHHLRIFYHYLRIAFLLLHGVPLFLSLFWSVAVSGCSYHVTRDHLGHFCLVPFHGTRVEVPWYLDLWDSPSDSHNHSNPFMSSRLENIMTSPLQLHDIELALRRQVSKLKEADTNQVREKPLQILGRLQPFAPDSVLGLLHELDTDRFLINQNN